MNIFGKLRQHIKVARSLGLAMDRPNSPDMPPKRTTGNKNHPNLNRLSFSLSVSHLITP